MIEKAALVSINADVQFRLKSDHAKTFWPFIDSQPNFTYVNEERLYVESGTSKQPRILKKLPAIWLLPASLHERTPSYIVAKLDALAAAGHLSAKPVTNQARDGVNQYRGWRVDGRRRSAT